MSPLAPLTAGPGALHPLLAPLGSTCRINVKSDTAHATALGTRLVNFSKATLTAVPEVHGIQDLRPSAILLELAEASTPALLPPGLVDLSLRWAWLRYCWAFAAIPAGAGTPPGTPATLALSTAAMKTGQHHKVVASDQLGVGFGLWLARKALETRHAPAYTTVADADEVIDGGGLGGLGLTAGSGTRPDYFIKVGSLLGPWSMLYVLECKGTHGNSNHAQLRKGIEQSVSVKHIATSQAPPAVVCATRMSDQRIAVRMVDPPGDEDSSWAGEETEPATRRAVITEAEGYVGVDDAAAFREELSQYDRASLMAFAGQSQSAVEALPERLRDVARSRRPSTEVPPLGDAETVKLPGVRPARGVAASIPLADGQRLVATSAVDDEVLDAASSPDPAAVRTARAELNDTYLPPAAAKDRRTRVESVDGGIALRITSPSGRVLELRVK